MNSDWHEINCFQIEKMEEIEYGEKEDINWNMYSNTAGAGRNGKRES
jgi:hypothetical protein